ncbi:uncharacterized protein BJX67DRAFT_367083 [Aspergillus lucknowensis]|uniref:Uncharacterized protein n=1 Tax=Aspergillus lucknowensis TaxID=176173 RepID=A0ABR4L9B3_9EURO
MVYGKYGPGSVSQTISVSGAPASAGTFVSGTGSGSISGLGKRRAESIARSSSASPSVAASVPASVSASVSAPPAVSSMAYEGGDGTKSAPPVTSLTTSPDAIWTGTVTAPVPGIGIRKAESAIGENQAQDRGLEVSNDYQLGDWREGESMLQLLSPMSFSPPVEQEDQKGGGKVCVEQADERARMDSLFEEVNETAGQVGDMKVDEAVKEEKDELIIGFLYSTDSDCIAGGIFFA